VIALVSVLTSATVAICVPLLTTRIEARRWIRQIRVSRLDELRAVADSASVALAEAENVLLSTELAVERARARAATPAAEAAATAAVEQAAEATEAVQRALHRTAVRLGWRSPVTQLYATAHDVLTDELTLLDDVREGGPCSDDPAAWNEVARALHAVRERYSRSREQFYTETSRLVGIEA
jgi:hypothetical protein